MSDLKVELELERLILLLILYVHVVEALTMEVCGLDYGMSI